MGKLIDFLTLPDVSEIVEDIYVSERLGTFKVKPMTQIQFDNLQKRCTDNKTQKFDGNKFNVNMIINQVIEPNFSDAKFLEKAGVVAPSDFIYKKILPGEIAEISAKLMQLSGFDTEMNEEIEEAKN